MTLLIMALPIFIYSILHSGPPSCLCSEVGECINTGDNEVEVVPNISQVKSFHIEGNIESTYKFFRKKSARTYAPPTLSVVTTLGKNGKKNSGNYT